ncbi:MAG: RT0821/Lpp0805 family surface protein [Azospirillaceae bacterium]|nr:RT0821/Lpp0805 family surface protein [Azospirillaceae bacterium]
MLTRSILLVTAAALLSSCSLFDDGKPTESPTAAANPAAAPVGKPGIILGPFLAADIGKSLDATDQALAGKAAQTAFTVAIGEQTRWTNPQNGHFGTITPTKDGFTVNGAYCREFQETVNVAGQSQQAFGTACQQPDKTWKIVN